jgi:LPS sulfotransferase NodH
MSGPTCYLMLATPRSGSTLLGQGLQASGLAGDPKEFFGHKMPFWMERWGTPSLESYVARLVSARSTANGVFGAKLLYQQLLHLEGLARQDPQLTDQPLASILEQLFPNLHLIWVSRNDKVRQAISWFKARQTGVWGQDTRREAPKLGRAWRIGDEPLQPGELAFDYEGIAALFRQAETEDSAIERFCAENAVDPFHVVYEDFAPRYTETVVEILRWMGVTPGDLSLAQPRTIKLADDRTDEWVERFQELQAANATM